MRLPIDTTTVKFATGGLFLALVRRRILRGH